MLGLGSKFPNFNLKAVSEKPIQVINIDNVTYKGKWKVIFFYPKDFTFVCPTEISAFGELNNDFSDRDAQILGVSVDSEHAHWAWRKEQKELKELPFPLVSDLKRQLSTDLGILDKSEGV